MVQVLLIGGNRDGEIEEREFQRDGVIVDYTPTIVSSRSPHTEVRSAPRYIMDSMRIDGEYYAFASCKSIEGSEIERLIKASKLKPM
ncbi:TPA: hypothetical protein P7Z40_002028 [Klebsiella pneumoniae]|uniref:hypothetical protein n=1 Tax=Enterobacteriaceae TaxID=543 RepID=UPI00042F0FF7|nr:MULTISPECIES: hypothetical protein [Enterobacteriaceae]AHM32378.1 hypothetical protein BU34_21050 [Escherichia coli]AHM36934.1 hypothetical protein CF57_09005 [Escherichia coli]AHM41544.1 hypothetical protein CF61_09715 [Escherichia coli]EAC1624836.1 hypothetical protein [Escherichia coli]EFA5275286.1 hypothetical protein [Escherichia coli]